MRTKPATGPGLDNSGPASASSVICTPGTSMVPRPPSVFKNPPGGSAGRWIDELGLKGLRRGGACVSERHANFIVNANGLARAGDVLSLVDEIRARVLGAFGVRLETEIVIA